MSDSDPTITLYLDGDVSILLGRRESAGTTPNLKVQMHDTSRAATLVIPGYCPSTNTFNLPRAIQGSLLDVYDKDTDSKLSVPPGDDEPKELKVEAGARNQWFDLKIDARDEFWTRLLEPGHKYEIRWRRDDKVPSAYHEDQQLRVRLLSRAITCNVFEETARPPLFSVSLSPTAEVCHLSGDPRFGFQLRITSHSEDTITLCWNKTPLKELHGLEEVARVTDKEGEEVEWPYGIGCFEIENEPFPSDDMFHEFEPEEQYERTFWLEKFDKDTSNGGELEELESGGSYKAKVSETLFDVFSKWRKGGKEDLLAGGEDEKRKRWAGNSGRILLDVSDPFTFEVI